ncbi:MAG: hypothetical protein K2N04_05935 [Alistipes sp.]|nr:hypothetical protein [Alistipes sp.]
MPRILFILLCAAFVCGTGCADQEDVHGKQRTNIVNFLERSHQPRLISEEAYEEGSRLPFYTTLGDAVFRYIDVEQYFDPDRENWPEVTDRSWVTVTFTAYVFRNAAIVGVPDGGVTESNFSSVTQPFFSNDPAFEPYLHMAGLTPGVWRFEPSTFDMRNPGIIKGLHLALLGCRQGDRVEAYMTYNMAYGDKTYMYAIPQETPIAIFFSVDKVE